MVSLLNFIIPVNNFIREVELSCVQRLRLGDVAVFENRQPVIAAKFINKSSLFILLLGFILRLELKPNSEQKAESLYSSPRHIAKPNAVRLFLGFV